MIVHAHDDERVDLVARRNGEDDRLRTPVEVFLEDRARPVLPRRLDHDVDAESGPIDVARGLRLEDLDRAPLRVEGIPLDPDRVLEASVDGVEAEEVFERGRVGDVDDRRDLDVGAVVDDAEDVPADAAETHQTDADGHVLSASNE